jgi:hypothetical protein
MYAGSTLVPLKRFDAWFGAHQKIDRLARRNLADLLAESSSSLPSSKDIAKFEGLGGPDGLKRKASGAAELRHFYNPNNPEDDGIFSIINQQYDDLVQAFKNQDHTRAAFEMAWLAHGLVDGLTPAHHYPYDEELMKLRGGQGMDTRVNRRTKLVMPGPTVGKWISNNWKMWGDRGLLATHLTFEWGIALMINPLRFRDVTPSPKQLAAARQTSLEDLFRAQASSIANLHMYDYFYKHGWTAHLAKVARQELLPPIINTVTLAWYKAALEARMA